MPKKLSEHEIARYERDGFLFPIDVMSPAEAARLRARLEEAEARHPQVLNRFERMNGHICFTFLDEIVHHPAIVDAVEDLIGENILASDTVLFIKEPRSPGFVSWHQDFTYMGLEPHEGVTAWLALTPSNRRTGCMQMLPGTHRHGQLPHRDTFHDDNILTRGQTIDGLDTTGAVAIELEPGQMSLHHPRVIHGSEPNTGDTRRIGVSIQSYIPPRVHQTKVEAHATLVRGRDIDGHYRLTPRPRGDMEPDAEALRAHINAQWADVLYEGATRRRRY
jgi:hypothetical protein